MLWLAASTASVSQSISVPVSRAKQPGIADILGGAGLLGCPRGLGDRGSDWSGEEWSRMKIEKCLHMPSWEVLAAG